MHFEFLEIEPRVVFFLYGTLSLSHIPQLARKACSLTIDHTC